MSFESKWIGIDEWMREGCVEIGDSMSRTRHHAKSHLELLRSSKNKKPMSIKRENIPRFIINNKLHTYFLKFISKCLSPPLSFTLSRRLALSIELSEREALKQLHFSRNQKGKSLCGLLPFRLFHVCTVLISLSKLTHQWTSETKNSICYGLKNRVYRINDLTENSWGVKMRETQSC